MDSSTIAGSESKKRHVEELREFEPKRAKIKDLESVFRSEEKTKINTTSTPDLNADDDTPSGTNYVKSQGHERDSMRVWKEMKQNGFLSSSSSSRGGAPVLQIPKSRGRKKGNELVIKKKIEIAKKEQVDRFAKVAAPSGLLNELNPGIINHVRNRKQVHSIIENLVRSARKENKLEEIRGHDDLMIKDKLECEDEDEDEDDMVALKLLSSENIGSINTSSLSNEESGNVSIDNSLSVKAASVASQWLELVHQDIKGRLAELKRSKKRVRAVTQTELPLLVSQESISNQESDNFDLHKKRWCTLFDQMENALSEEEKHLESLLNQVNEMLMHCENGLLQFHPENALQKRANDCRFSKAERSPYNVLAVQGAAAAIYSTSNFLQSMENLPCY